MSKLITYFIECPHDCDGEAESTTLDTTQPDSGPLRIDVAMAVESETFVCNKCGCEFFTGDLHVEDEGEKCYFEDDEDDMTAEAEA